jgi:hypothetical protein
MFETVKHIQSPHQFLTKLSRTDEPPICFYTIFGSVWLDLKSVKISLAIQTLVIPAYAGPRCR